MNSVQMFRHVVLTHDRYKEKNILTINSEKSSRGFSEEHAMTQSLISLVLWLQAKYHIQSRRVIPFSLQSKYVDIS